MEVDFDQNWEDAAIVSSAKLNKDGTLTVRIAIEVTHYKNGLADKQWDAVRIVRMVRRKVG